MGWTRTVHVWVASLIIWATPSIAKQAEVLRVSGAVFHGQAQAPLPRQVIDKQKLDGMTIVETGANSTVRLRLPAGQEVLLGRGTKLTLQQIDSQESAILTLHEGRLRVKGSKAALRVTTPYATIETREGELHFLSYKAQEISTLIVYEGEAKLAKNYRGDQLRELTRAYWQREIRAEEIERNRQGEIELRPELELRERQHLLLSALLAADNVVTVRAGQVASVVNYFDAPLLAQKMAPAQFNILYANSDFTLAPENPSYLSEQELQVEPSLRYGTIAQRPEGVWNRSQGKVAPKAGGVVDLRTGYYHPPGEEAPFYGPLGIYIPQTDLVKVEKSSGHVLLDAKADQVPAFYTALKEKTDARTPLSNREKMANEQIFFTLMPIDQSLEAGANREFDSKSGQIFRLGISHSSGSFWQLENTLVLKRLKFDAVSGVDISRKALYGLDMAARFFVTGRLGFRVGLGMEQDHFYESLSNNASFSAILTPVNTVKLKTTAEWRVVRSGSFDLETRLSLIYHLGQKVRNLKTDGALGYGLELEGRYWPSKRWALVFGPSYELVNQSSNEGGVEREHERRTLGVTLGARYFY